MIRDHLSLRLDFLRFLNHALVRQRNPHHSRTRIHSVAIVLALDLFTHHPIDTFDSHACHARQPSDDLFMLVQEYLAEDELVGAQAHAFHLGDVGDDLLNDMAVVRADLVQLFTFRVCIGSAFGDRNLSLILPEVFFPVSHRAWLKHKFVLAAMR